MEMLTPTPPERKEKGPMKHSGFYEGVALAMTAGMVAIAIALSFNAYANWTAVECTTVYYTEHSDVSFGSLVPGTQGRVHHSCFDRFGAIVGGDDLLSDFDPLITTSPRFPPPSE